jgi:hypothetical protein
MPITISPIQDIDVLRQEYLRLTNAHLPSIAGERHFPVRLNHCFQRIILDNLFGGCWYDFLEKCKIPAYKQLNPAQLQQAITIAQNLCDRSNDYIVTLNQLSLKWRGEVNC